MTRISAEATVMPPKLVLPTEEAVARAMLPTKEGEMAADLEVRFPMATAAVEVPSRRPRLRVVAVTAPAFMVKFPVAVLPELCDCQPRMKLLKVPLTVPPVKSTVPLGLAVPPADL